MKVTVLKDDLVAALERVRWTVSDSKMIQLHQCFCFRAGTVAAYNGVAGTVTNFNLGDADFAVNADKFFRIISSLFDTIDLTFKKDGVLLIKSGGNETKLGTIVTKAFPDVKPKTMSSFCTAPNLIECLKSVAFTIGTNAMKPELMGVGIRGDGVYSCDIDRISRARLQSPAAGAVNIPAKSIEHICRLGNPDMMFTSEGRVGVYHKSTETIYVSSMLAAGFPFEAADQVIKRNSGQHVTELPATLAESIARVTQLSDRENAEVIIEGDSEGVTVSCKSEEGTAREVVHCNLSQVFKIACRPNWFRQALGESSQMDLTTVMSGDQRSVRFYRENFDHILGLMALPQ